MSSWNSLYSQLFINTTCIFHFFQQGAISREKEPGGGEYSEVSWSILVQLAATMSRPLDQPQNSVQTRQGHKSFMDPPDVGRKMDRCSCCELLPYGSVDLHHSDLRQEFSPQDFR